MVSTMRRDFDSTCAKIRVMKMYSTSTTAGPIACDSASATACTVS